MAMSERFRAIAFRAASDAQNGAPIRVRVRQVCQPWCTGPTAKFGFAGLGAPDVHVALVRAC